MGMFRYVAHEDPAWDWRTFDLDRDSSLIDKKAGFIDAVNADLSAFRARGENFSSTTVGMTAARVGRSRRRTASTITRACWHGWGRSKRIGCDSSWCPVWLIAGVGRALTR